MQSEKYPSNLCPSYCPPLVQKITSVCVSTYVHSYTSLFSTNGRMLCSLFSILFFSFNNNQDFRCICHLTLQFHFWGFILQIYLHTCKMPFVLGYSYLHTNFVLLQIYYYFVALYVKWLSIRSDFNAQQWRTN